MAARTACTSSPNRGAAPVKVIADLHTPLGLVWYGGSLSVSSNARIDAYSGFNGRAFASHRTVVAFPSGTGQLNGLASTPNGRLIVGISAPCDHCTPTLEWSASVVSLLPDGSDVRVVASGIRAPIGLVYYPGTSDLFVTMNQPRRRDPRRLAGSRGGRRLGLPELLREVGSSYTGSVNPFLTGLTSPVPLLVAPDGGLLIGDWGTGMVYRIVP
jgi:hypothetical protein